ncbi:tRNA dimethylallyltransferase [Nymphon striatum]|nr:tRNA dimethylallyltransferase [Nymphon striatum]
MKKITSNGRQIVVVVLGSTGTGKSKLAIELAKMFCGEIISADSMQVYKGLDIITNKVKDAEQQEIPHHLIDYVDPIYNYSVTDFRDEAVPLIEKLFNSGNLPIIVGGTNYYIEAILWKVLVSNLGSRKNYSYVNKSFVDMKENQKVLESDVSLHDKLKAIDPTMAAKIHPKDHRKIHSSLEVVKQHGRLHSDIINEQKQMDGGSSLGAPLRYKDAIIFWLDAEKNSKYIKYSKDQHTYCITELDERLDERVDSMMRQGLVEELITFSKMLHSVNNTQNDNELSDYTHGILQSIGFKEFHNYLTLTDDQRENDKSLSEKYLLEGVERLKLVTRRYARKQIKWITNRFLKKPDRQISPVYKLDSTDLSKWEENVYNPAVEILRSHINGSQSHIDPVPVDQNPPSNERITFNCEDCDRLIVGEIQWNGEY